MPEEEADLFYMEEALTFVTANWKCRSLIGCGDVLEKENDNDNALSACGALTAFMSIRRRLLLTTAWWSRGVDASGGSAEENDHSSSSFTTIGAVAGWGVAGFGANCAALRDAKGSLVF